VTKENSRTAQTAPRACSASAQQHSNSLASVNQLNIHYYAPMASSLVSIILQLLLLQETIGAVILLSFPTVISVIKLTRAKGTGKCFVVGNGFHLCLSIEH
jgi:hypothetical protein